MDHGAMFNDFEPHPEKKNYRAVSPHESENFLQPEHDKRFAIINETTANSWAEQTNRRET